MLSLYINIPFCQNKCKYCNFLVLPQNEMPEGENFIEKYFQALKKQIAQTSDIFQKPELKTIYFGGGTPLLLGKQKFIEIINLIEKNFDLENLEELSIELNPSPFDETIDFINEVNKTYKDFFRIRFSFGLQSFDDEILEQSGRDYYFNYLVIFLRQIQKIKQANNIFNFDFIAFGKFNKNKQGQEILRDYKRIEFLEKMAGSGFADSFSIYTLELFAGSQRFNQKAESISDETVQEKIYDEFEILKSIVTQNGYKRYEISNFSLAGRQSIHNTVYWEMGNYLGVGVGAHSFLKGDYKEIFLKNIGIQDNPEAIRFETNKSWDDYFSGNFWKTKDIKQLNEKDLLLEEFFLGLRTNRGIESLEKYKKILTKEYKSISEEYIKGGFMEDIAGNLKLTDSGMNVYNYIITNLIA